MVKHKKLVSMIYNVLIEDDQASVKSAKIWEKMLGESFNWEMHRHAFIDLYKRLIG